ncbi:MAG: small subunit ribosomal protein S3 [Parcubacteria group bacterium Gr01-1014_70]|nr:MAG: small subunit ribosomal protein S3 [Parcubacteria group bacterium Gr01-1014_70]
MTHTTHPYGVRLGILKPWRSRWFDARGYRQVLRTDTLLREYIWRELRGVLVESIEIERSPRALTIIIKTSQPGILIGRGGEGAEKLKSKIQAYISKLEREPGTAGVRAPQGGVEGRGRVDIRLNIEEVRMPETHANIVAQMMVQDLERRLPFRRVLKNAIEKTSANKEVLGVKVALKGRLDGAEMGRYEWLRRGRIPLQTLRADIDYALQEARLPYGTIGVKVWIYRGEVFSEKQGTK